MRIYCSDCEGPITLDDDALGQAEYFIDNGGNVFSVVSGYDDVLAAIDKKPNYRAGMTLQLMLPLLVAVGATNQEIAEYSAGHITFMCGAQKSIPFISNLMPTFIISTSWHPYIHEVCRQLGLPYSPASCSRLPNFDSFDITGDQKRKLRDITNEIAQMPEIDIPDDAISRRQLPEKTRAVVTRLDEIFWQQIPAISPGAAKMYEMPIVMGGSQKAEVIKNIAISRGVSLADVIYVGDSITDVKAFDAVRKAGGAAISFNGNRYAVEVAEFVCIANNNDIIIEVAHNFNEYGIKALMQFFINHTPLETLDPYSYSEDESFEKIMNGYSLVAIVRDSNRDALSKLSSKVRKVVRGRAGALG